MELISHDDFGKLRLSQFCSIPGKKYDPEDPSGAERFSGNSIVGLRNWEFMDRLWVGEALGFSEWLCLESDPEVLRSVSIDMIDLPREVVQPILKKLRLPVRRGMTQQDVCALLGKPKKVVQFTEDRKSYEFSCGSKYKYRIDCTVHQSDGLIYLVMSRQDQARKRGKK